MYLLIKLQEKDALVLSTEDEPGDKDEWPVPVKMAVALLALVLYSYCVVFVCTLYQRSQQLNHIDIMVSMKQSTLC